MLARPGDHAAFLRLACGQVTGTQRRNFACVEQRHSLRLLPARHHAGRMFRRKPDPAVPDPLALARLALDDALKREARVTALAWSGFQSAARMDEALREAHAGALPEARPLLEAFLGLHLGPLSHLPLRLLAGEDASEEFRAVFGFPPKLFRDPAQSAAQLLELRTQTATTYLLRLAAGGAVSLDDVARQGQADLETIIHQEREARRGPPA